MLRALHASAVLTTLLGTTGDFFAAAKGDRARAEHIKVAGDVVAGRRLVKAITGCLA